MGKMTKKLLALIVIASITMPMISINAYAASCRLNYTYFTMTGGYSFKLYVSGTGRKVTWSSSNKRIAKVSAKGKVEGLRKGKCYIYAKVGGKKLKCRVKVTSNKPGIDSSHFSKRVLNLSSVEIDLQRINYYANGYPYLSKSNGSFKLALLNNKKKVKWSSSNKKVAVVSSKGKVTAKKVGNCTVTAKVGKKKYKCKVKVTAHRNEARIEGQERVYKLIDYVNRERVKNKVAPCKIKKQLIKAATIRAMEIAPKVLDHTPNNDMVMDERFSHTRPNSLSYYTVLDEVGLKLGRVYGENLGYTIDNVKSLNSFSKESYEIFMKSFAHRSNMLNYEYDYIGVGYYRPYVYKSSNGASYTAAFWAQEFYSN